MKGRVLGEPDIVELAREFSRILRVPIEVHTIVSPLRSDSTYLSILAVRSPQGQVATYTPSQHGRYRGRRYAKPILMESTSVNLQERALFEIKERNIQGSLTLLFDESENFLELIPGITFESLWTLDFSFISHFENAVRAAHDLPLGNSEMVRNDWLLMEYEAPLGLDMTHPYLHLFAHNPNYRIKQLTANSGVVSVFGKSLEEQAEHAVDYLEGFIDE
jgi:5-(carboxyamino)imidazole ribonucleotide synthase